MIPDYTLVVGVDAKHLQQLSWSWPTWKRHKPSLLEHPMIVFRDKEEVTEDDVRAVVDHPNLLVQPWPFKDATYRGAGESKWTDPQRYKMLAGFVYIPALLVNTSYWLKIDTDVIATGHDNWIDPEWFRKDPAVVSHRWGYTKPPEQMLVLDRWFAANADKMPLAWAATNPLNLAPKPGENKVGHKRIISWCSFWDTQFTNECAVAAARTCPGKGQLPVPSQDGYLWYMAKRTGREIWRVNMKAGNRGWEHWSNERNVREAAERAMS